MHKYSISMSVYDLLTVGLFGSNFLQIKILRFKVSLELIAEQLVAEISACIFLESDLSFSNTRLYTTDEW